MLARVVFILTPVCALAFNVVFFAAPPSEIMLYLIPYLVGLYLVLNVLYGRVRWTFVSEIYDTVNAVMLSGTVLRTLFRPQGQKFRVTPKGIAHQDTSLSPLAWRFYVLLAIQCAASVYGGWLLMHHPELYDQVLVSLVWNSYNIIFTLAALGALIEKREVRRHPRIAVEEIASLEVNGKQIPCHITDMTEAGACLHLPEWVKKINIEQGVLRFSDANYTKKFSTILSFNSKITVQVRSLREGMFRNKKTLVAGVSFCFSHIQERRMVINYLYGESHRWRRQLIGKHQQSTITQGIIFLLMAVKYGLQHLWMRLLSLLKAGATMMPLFHSVFLPGGSVATSPHRRRFLCPDNENKATEATRWRKHMNPFMLFTIILCLLVCQSVAAWSAPVTPWQASMPLSAFYEDNEQQKFLELRQIESAETLRIPIPYRVTPHYVHVHMEFTNSVALLRGRSLIRLRWNNGVVAQTTLDPDFPDGVINVDIPAKWLNSGDNYFKIEVSQHYRADCEDPGSPELWTNIDMNHSYISVTGKLKPVPDQLTELDHWLSRLNWGEQRITLASLGTTDAHYHAGTILAQELGSKTHKPLLIDAIPLLHSLATLPRHQDVVLFGTYTEARRLTALHHPVSNHAGRIALLPRDDAPGYFLLLITAKNETSLENVASALTWSSLPLQAAAVMDIRSITPAKSSPYAAQKATMAGRTYTFADLGYKTHTLKGLHDHVRVQMWLPPDLFSHNHSAVELSLHFSYGAALRPDSVMNIYHNQVFLQSMSLSDPHGLQVTDYHISIPMSAFRPGMNTFVFESRMHANTGSNCTTGNTDNLLMTLYDDSSLSIPDAPHFLAMPDLYYTLNTGFPYLGSQGDQVILVPTMNTDALGAAWTLAARIGQLKGDPVRDLTVSNKPDGHANIIRLSSLGDIKPALWQHAPVDLGQAGVINHPMLRNPVALGQKTISKLEALYQLFWWSDRDSHPVSSYYQTRISHSAKILKNSGIMIQMENPKHPGGTMTLLLADDVSQLRVAVNDLVTLWPQLSDVHGDVLFWGRDTTTGTPDYNALELDTAQYHIGNISLLQRLEYFAIQYPVFLLSFLLVLLLVVSLLTRWILIHYRQQTNPDITP